MIARMSDYLYTHPDVAIVALLCGDNEAVATLGLRALRGSSGAIETGAACASVGPPAAATVRTDE